MTRCLLTCKRTPYQKGLTTYTPEIHWGYVCEIGPNDELFADIPDELLEIELSTGRAVLAE